MANAITFRLLQKRLGTEAAQQFAAGHDVALYGDLEKHINLYYWMALGCCIEPPLETEKRLNFARYAYATLEADRLIERHREPRKVNLKAARTIVTGGGGVGSKAAFQLIHDLAGAIGGAVGASRAAVDAGYIDKAHQVGQTGTTVRPSLYVAVGISGAIQHQAGMNQSQKIIAINNDPNAPIFGVAHYKILGDLNQVVPDMIKTIKKHVSRGL